MNRLNIRIMSEYSRMIFYGVCVYYADLYGLSPEELESMMQSNTWTIGVDINVK